MKTRKKTWKAISLKQPWANLVASGKKTIETRKWTTNYRGDLVICSSKNPNIYPAGYVLCIVELYDVRPMTKKDEKKACIKVHPRAYAWFLRNIRPVGPPIQVKGTWDYLTLKLSSNSTAEIKFKSLLPAGILLSPGSP